MSTLSTNPTRGLPEAASPPAGLASPAPAVSALEYTPFPVNRRSAGEWDEPSYGGLSLSAWLKIGVVAVLMALLFRFNLSRLWLKTNPYSGQANWGHAFFVPLIGLYYLYVHRRELIDPPPAPPPSGSMPVAWGLSVLTAITAGLLAWAVLPPLFGWLEVPLQSAGILSNYHGWPLVPLYLLVFFAIGSAAVIFGGKSDVWRREVTAWATRTWPLLLTWAMVTLAAWGVGFFVSVVSKQVFGLVKPVLALGSLLSLGAVVWGGRAAIDSLRRVAERLQAGSATWFGGFVMAWGILFSFWGIWPGQNDFFKDVGMVIALFGVVLLLGGWGVMRTAWFPVLFLFCALPWPDQVYSWLAGPLQHLAAAVAVRVLTLFGVPSQVSGTKIIMGLTPVDTRVLNVAEACAGLRSLMTFISLASGWAFLFMSSRPLWQRLALAASAVPIAILCNVMRVSGQGLIDHFWSHQLSEGFAHQFAGLVMLVPAFFMILLVGWILDQLFIEEADEAVARSSAGGAGGARGAVAIPGGRAVGLGTVGKGVRDAGKAGKVLVVPRPGAVPSSPKAAAAKSVAARTPSVPDRGAAFTPPPKTTGPTGARAAPAPSGAAAGPAVGAKAGTKPPPVEGQVQPAQVQPAQPQRGQGPTSSTLKSPPQGVRPRTAPAEGRGANPTGLNPSGLNSGGLNSTGGAAGTRPLPAKGTKAGPPAGPAAPSSGTTEGS